MNYEEKKKEIINKKDYLLKEYKVLFYKTMRLAVEMGNMDELPLSPIEMIDWMMFSANDAEMEKFTRLIVALQYVESPKDKEIISSLKENIKINNSKTK